MHHERRFALLESRLLSQSKSNEQRTIQTRLRTLISHANFDQYKIQHTIATYLSRTRRRYREKHGKAPRIQLSMRTSGAHGPAGQRMMFARSNGAYSNKLAGLLLSLIYVYLEPMCSSQASSEAHFLQRPSQEGCICRHLVPKRRNEDREARNRGYKAHRSLQTALLRVRSHRTPSSQSPCSLLRRCSLLCSLLSRPRRRPLSM